MTIRMMPLVTPAILLSDATCDLVIDDSSPCGVSSRCYLIKATGRILILALLLADASTARALFIRDYDAARHERFSEWHPINPIRNDSFFLSEFDFSGVGWRLDSISVTMISPQHFVGAAHTGFLPGQPIYVQPSRRAQAVYCRGRAHHPAGL